MQQVDSSLDGDLMGWTGEQVSARNKLASRRQNRRKLLLALLRYQPVARVRLASLCNLSTTTVTNLIAEMTAMGVVEETGADQEIVHEGAGRPAMGLRYVAQSRFALGIHIGVRTVRLALTNLLGNIVDNEVMDQVEGEPARDALERIAALSCSLIGRNGLAQDSERLVGVGVGVSGLVDADTGVNLLSPNLGWCNVPVRNLLSSTLHLPVVADNNVRCMALAESLYGAGRHLRALAFVYARVGVGAGLVVDGQIYRGAGFGAGEIGHWTMELDGGAACRCGKYGCLETLIGEPILVELARQIAGASAFDGARPLDEVFAAARAGHAQILAMLHERARYAGVALGNLVNVLNPQTIVVGGLLYEGYDLLHDVLEETMRRHAFHGLGESVKVVPSTFGLHVAELGAAALAFDQFFFT